MRNFRHAIEQHENALDRHAGYHIFLLVWRTLMLIETAILAQPKQSNMGKIGQIRFYTWLIADAQGKHGSISLINPLAFWLEVRKI